MCCATLWQVLYPWHQAGEHVYRNPRRGKAFVSVKPVQPGSWSSGITHPNRFSRSSLTFASHDLRVGRGNRNHFLMHKLRQGQAGQGRCRTSPGTKTFARFARKMVNARGDGWASKKTSICSTTASILARLGPGARVGLVFRVSCAFDL